MKMLLTAALALASASALGQDAPAAAEAIQDFYADAALLLKEDCRTDAPVVCGRRHRGDALLEWSATCREAAQWRNLGRNYNGNAVLAGKYKDAILFWDSYCSIHPEYEAAQDAAEIGVTAASAVGSLRTLVNACKEGTNEGACLLLQGIYALTGCFLKGINEDACMQALVEALEPLG